MTRFADGGSLNVSAGLAGGDSPVVAAHTVVYDTCVIKRGVRKGRRRMTIVALSGGWKMRCGFSYRYNTVVTTAAFAEYLRVVD